MTVPEILQAGFRSGFIEGVNHGYWIGFISGTVCLMLGQGLVGLGYYFYTKWKTK